MQWGDQEIGAMFLSQLFGTVVVIGIKKEKSDTERRQADWQSISSPSVSSFQVWQKAERLQLPEPFPCERADATGASWVDCAQAVAGV